MQAFNYVKRKTMKPNDGMINGQSYLDNISAMQVGFGSEVLRIDRDGIWLGAQKFADAPFSVDMVGRMVAALLTIKDTNGTTIIDGTGLVSGANFASDSVTSLANSRTTSSTSFVDVANTSLTFSLVRSTKVLFLASGDFANYVGNDEVSSEYVALNIDGTLYPDASNGFGNVQFMDSGNNLDDTPVNGLYTWSSHYLATLGAGSHTAKLQFAKQASGAVTVVNARVSNTQLTYLVLGK